MTNEAKSLPKRREIYQLARRSLVYPVYLTLELIALAVAGYLSFSDLVLRDTSMHWFLIATLVAAIIAHSFDLTEMLPHILYRSIRIGLVIFVLGWAGAFFTSLKFTPLIFAVCAASVYYLWCGERLTIELYRRQALLSAVHEMKRKAASSISA